MNNSIQDRGPNFREDGKLYLLRCFKCEPNYGRENYMLAVASGQCAWCGWKEEEKPMTHTPTPWKIRAYGEPGAVTSKVYFRYCLNDDALCYSTDRAEAEANAAFIVRACNAHERMLKAIKWALACMADHTTSLTEELKEVIALAEKPS